MKYEVVVLEEKTVAGISARTNNGDTNVQAVIGGLWGSFFEKGIYAGINNKINEKALGIYTDYSGDEKGDYTVMVACEVAAKTEQDSENENIIFRKIPAGKYAKFVVKGDMVKAVAECWQKIWEMDLPRAFVCDFEEYQNESMDEAEIHIYISLKE